ncbi:hypothetical protein TSOC_007198 [Tetrabaena socialis]|uniref:Serine-threonine/tyrosine-protein kinase catalytic domain-containing protein n=1 Tax=Tetrabaena socialis TaxID=47790 RepID=A0A2J8A1K2_9CHLO|nr:hypothetical protein TSOC_007198 [Tetrabaena socialis]|eukprot:PNH06406.1 hypothetical protein TSOC_007198 [Tetrabaena socialis]
MPAGQHAGERRDRPISFAIIMHGALTWLPPYAEYDDTTQVMAQHAAWNDSQPIFRPQLPPDEELPQVSRGSSSLAAYKQLMVECWAQRPEDRPSFGKAADRLQALILAEQAAASERASP